MEPIKNDPYNLVFDVGMHLGEDTDYYIACGMRVVAFEANPELVSKCEKRFAREIASGQLRIVFGAISPEGSPPEITFYVSDKSVWGTTSKEWSDRNSALGVQSKAVTVPAVNFENILREYGAPVYIKVDVEGADRCVLSAISKTGMIPTYLSVESEKDDFDKLVSDIELLYEIGYRKFRAVQQASIPGRRQKILTRSLDEIEYTFSKHASGPFGVSVQQPWKDKDGVIRDYKAIFRSYALFGDRSFLRGLPLVGQFVRLGNHFRTMPIPGWHDLHVGRPDA